MAAVLSTTALSSILVLGAPELAAAQAVRDAKPAKAKPAGKTAAKLPPEVARALKSSHDLGSRGLVAGVFEAAHREPGQRDAILSYARSLVPGAARDLTVAADLGVLTAGRTLALAPNAGQVLSTRLAGNPGGSVPAYAPTAGVAPRALPNPAPPAGDQTWNRDLIGASVAYGRGFTGQGVTVAVGDTGFDIANDALRNQLDLTRARNYVLNSAGDAYDPTQVGVQSPQDSHGSHVSGIIAAEQLPGVDMHGIAYNAKIVPIRVILAGPDAPNAVYAPGLENPFADALNYFASLDNVKIYNASYGPSPDRLPALSVWKADASEAEYKAAINVLKADKIIVAATGNERDDHPVAGRNPSGLALYPFIHPNHNNAGVYDAGGEQVDLTALQRQNGLIIGVMSVGANKAAAAYSNYCGVTAAWCVAAPGGNMPHDTGVFAPIPDNTYGFLHGTSMAAPAVSGALAVLIEAYPGYNARDLARLLFSTTEDLGDPGLDAVFGHGLIRLDRATDGPTTLAAGSTVTVNAGDTIYWSRPLVTSGDFDKDGDGVLTISGRTATPGNVAVGLGTLAVDGTLSVTGGGHTLGIGQNGTLAGIGEVVGNTTIAGTLSPGRMPNVGDLIANGVLAPGSTVTGNSPGTLTFTGNVTLTSTATTRVDIDGTFNTPGGPGTHDKIVVSGANHVFTANGTLLPVLRGIAGGYNDHTPTIGTAYRIVDAQDGAKVAGAFTTLTQPVAGLTADTRFDLAYTTTSIALAVTPTSFAALGGAPLSGPQSSVAGVLDIVRAAPSSRAASVLNSMYLLSGEAEYREALVQLGGPGQPATPGAVMSTFSSFGSSVATRQGVVASGGGNVQSATMQGVALGYAGGAPVVEARGADAFASFDTSARPSAAQWSLWGQAFGRWSRVGAELGLPGSTGRSGGFAVGADRLLAPDFVGGVAMGFARTTTNSAGSQATSDSYSGSLYGTWTPGRFVIDGRVAAGPTLMNTSRSLTAFGTANGKANGFGGLVAGEIGYRMTVAAFTVKPYVGLEWQTFHRRAYDETAAFGLSYPAQSFNKLVSTLGTQISTRFRTAEGLTLMPEIKLAWAHDLRDTTLVTQTALLDNAFTVSAASPGRDAALAGLTLTGWTRENFRLFASYNGEFRRNAHSHALTGGGRWSW